MSVKRYLVTGGAGFIGSSLVRALLERGATVRVLDNFATGKRQNLADVRDRIELVEADIAESEAVLRACQEVDIVLHQAALPSVARSVLDPASTHRANATGTLNLLEAARKCGVKRVVFAASSSAYGETPTLPKEEGMTPLPQSPYAASKLAGEHYLSSYSHCYGLETISLRYFNVFGPRQDPAAEYAAVIPRFVTAALRGQSPVVYGDGRQTRDFCYIDNVVQANLLACDALRTQGEVVNIACDQEIDLLGVLDLLANLCGHPISPRFEPPRPGDIRRSRASIERARTLLGYKPTVEFAEGLKRTFAYFRALI